MDLLLLIAAATATPACMAPSHDRLLVQSGRDVCAAALDARGQPRAAGFMPTVCPRPGQTYRIDAHGDADLCIETKPGGAS
jgi:hypothetical protein